MKKILALLPFFFTYQLQTRIVDIANHSSLMLRVNNIEIDPNKSEKVAIKDDKLYPIIFMENDSLTNYHTTSPALLKPEKAEKITGLTISMVENISCKSPLSKYAAKIVEKESSQELCLNYQGESED